MTAGTDTRTGVQWPAKPPESSRVAVELCCGMGGIGIGLAATGYKVVKAYDSWAAAVAIYNHNAPEPVAVRRSLLTEAGRATIKAERRSLGDVDLLAAGPPCKGFSQIRNGHHHGPSRHNRVLLAIPGFVAVFRPRLVLIENVPDLLRHRGGRTFRDLVSDLERPGPRLRYHVEHGIYDAALFGTPQARRRLLILAVRSGSPGERLPAESPDLTLLYGALRHSGRIPEALKAYATKLADASDMSLTTAEQALSDLPLLGAGEPEIPREYASPALSAYQKAMRAQAPQFLSATRTPAVRPETVERLALIPPGGCARHIPHEQLNGLSRRYDSAYRRLHPGAPSTALSTKYDCVYHYSQHRSLSVREYARLQGIPDYFAFPEDLACRRFAYEMIGNSVPPFLVHGVLSQVAADGKPREAG